MNRVLAIVVNVVVWCAILGYLVFASGQCSRSMEEVPVSDITIEVWGHSQDKALTPETVRGWLEEKELLVEGMPLESVNTREIRELLLSQGFVKSARVWTELRGRVQIEITQRRPVMRVMTEDGYDFYVSEDFWILPSATGRAEYLPLVSGKFPLPFGQDYSGAVLDACDGEEKKSVKNYNFLVKLINFVRLIESDPFWDAQIVQIDVRDKGDSDWKEPEVDLIPRVGSHVVVFGSLDEAREKLDKLALFYDNVLDYEGWDKYKFINVRYKDQVVCTK